MKQTRETWATNTQKPNATHAQMRSFSSDTQQECTVYNKSSMFIALQKLFDKLHPLKTQCLLSTEISLAFSMYDKSKLFQRPAKGASSNSHREVETINLGGSANTILGKFQTPQECHCSAISAKLEANVHSRKHARQQLHSK